MARYAKPVGTRVDMLNRFTHHPPTEEQFSRYETIRKAGHALAILLVDNCPDSRETSLAITKIEEAIMWANASIARNETQKLDEVGE